MSTNRSVGSQPEVIIPPYFCSSAPRYWLKGPVGKNTLLKKLLKEKKKRVDRLRFIGLRSKAQPQISQINTDFLDADFEVCGFYRGI